MGSKYTKMRLWPGKAGLGCKRIFGVFTLGAVRQGSRRAHETCLVAVNVTVPHRGADSVPQIR